MIAVPLGTGRCSYRSGRCGSDASSCTCSTPISKRTRRGIAICRRGCTAAIARRASSRKSCSESAACGRCKALGIDPAVWHLNEGHAAFVVLQRIRDSSSRARRFDAALEEVRRTTVFTTHTPVPAGHDAFPFPVVETHLPGAWGTLGEYRDRFLALGVHDSGSGPQFNMTALAMRTAGGDQRRQPAPRRK